MSRGHKPNKPIDQNPERTPEPRGYEAPRLVELGSLRDLTHGGGGGSDLAAGGPDS